jgi:hypothetical protein
LEKGGEVIKVSSSQFVVIGFAQSTNYVNQAARAFEKTCPNGEIGSIISRYYTALGFFSWTNHVEFQGIYRGTATATVKQ